MSQVALPFITASDPDLLGEGTLDPLGLGGLADDLADLLAPEVTARMSRVRFLTAIAACSRLFGGDLRGEDGTPAYLAFEWVVVEAMVRSPPPTGTDAVPGASKARGYLRGGADRHLDAQSYLKTPKVFGFHGVYKRLARDLQIVDTDFELLPNGEELLLKWEREQGLDGFMVASTGGQGRKLARRLTDAVRGALAANRVQVSKGAYVWKNTSEAFAPGAALRKERKLLWSWLASEQRPVRTELLNELSQFPADLGESELVELLLARPISDDLRWRLEAVVAYEDVARHVDLVLRVARVQATEAGPAGVTPGAVAGTQLVRTAATRLAPALTLATERLERVDADERLGQVLGPFVGISDPETLVEATLARHDEVSLLKGKRPWFERDAAAIVVRPVGHLRESAERGPGYLHPYRLNSLRRFIGDLKP